MSETRDTLAGIVSERETWTAENCKNLRTGGVFAAEYEDGQPIELRDALGRDPRESGIIHVTSDAAAADILDQQLVAVLLFGVWQKFRVLGRVNNPGSVQTDFSLAVVTNKDAL